eukprot:XP_019072398.1 PREDICTED: uncharacterized protein LOC100262661 isoform X2 [Vitis vinifera]
MRGIGGPLLCIGDLLTDVGEADPHSDQPSPLSPSSSPSMPFSPHTLQPSHLNRLFQENYDQLNKAFAGTDHSWTALTLKVMDFLSALLCKLQTRWFSPPIQMLNCCQRRLESLRE